ncbi:MAG: hypothetical protein AAGD07_10175 [Planctomycetota bacterium]
MGTQAGQPSERWKQITQQAPQIFAIVCGISFMNAKDSVHPGLSWVR